MSELKRCFYNARTKLATIEHNTSDFEECNMNDNDAQSYIDLSQISVCTGVPIENLSISIGLCCMQNNVTNEVDSGRNVSQIPVSSQNESQSTMFTSPRTRSLSYWKQDDSTMMSFSPVKLSPMQASSLVRNNVASANANITEDSAEGIDDFSMIDFLSNNQFSPMQKREQAAFFKHHENQDFYKNWECGNDTYQLNKNMNRADTLMQENTTQNH